MLAAEAGVQHGHRSVYLDAFGRGLPDLKLICCAGWSSPLLVDASQTTSPLRWLLPGRAQGPGNCLAVETSSGRDGVPRLYIFTSRPVGAHELLVLAAVPPVPPPAPQVRHESCIKRRCCQVAWPVGPHELP